MELRASDAPCQRPTAMARCDNVRDDDVVFRWYGTVRGEEVSNACRGCGRDGMVQRRP